MKNYLVGGKGDALDPKTIPREELEDAIRVEMEHTKDREIAQEIALDHFSEDREYYRKLRQIEKSLRVKFILSLPNKNT